MPAKLPALIGASMGLMLLPLISVPSANAASFNCSKASNIVETLICTDPNLSQLDEKMDAAYSVARAQSQNQQQLLQDQRAWVASRNQCQTAKCVSDAYNQRLAALAGQPRAGGTAFDTSQTAMTTAAVSASAAPSAVYATTPDGKKIQTMMADGMGSTIESALQNAAENALKNVVGSFVTSEKMAERYSQISEGVRSETKKLSSQTHEYSQAVSQPVV